jgi:MraZ protein
MTFRGLNEHSLDSKDRITVPAQYRASFADGIVLRQGIEPCVEIWPVKEAEKDEDRTLAQLNPMSRDARRIQRRFFAHSESVDLDSAGRVRLSRQLIEYAGLEGRCVVNGVGSRLEIWSPERWLAEDEENEQLTSELTEGIAATQRASSPGSA